MVINIKWHGRFMVNPNRRVIFQKAGSLNILSLILKRTILMCDFDHFAVDILVITILIFESILV